MPTDASPPIKVLLVTARADLGGGPRHVLDLINAFAKNEVQFFMASPEQEPFAPLFRERCAGFVTIPSRQFSLSAFVQLYQFIERERINLIHSHGRGAGLYSRLLGVITGRPALHSFHGIHTEASLSGRVKLLLDQVLAFFPFQAIFSSPQEHQRAKDHHVIRSQPFTVIFNAVDLTRFSVAKQPRSNSIKRVGVFLRDDPAKGPDLWLQLVTEALKDPSLASKVVFSCAGIRATELSRFGPIPEVLELAGPLKNPVPWLEGLDLLVSTSRSEGLPLGVLEAMAAQVPCLLSKITGHQMFFDHGVATAFDSSDPAAFVSGINEVLNRGAEVEARAKTAHQWVSEDFSLSVFHERLLELYEKAPCSRSPIETYPKR